jgi:hypothetical protein
VSSGQDSALTNGGIGDVCSQDGYKLIRAEQLIGALGALNEREITFRAFRTYIGCFELLAIREAAERSNPLKRRKRRRRFLQSELEELIDAEEGSSISRELSSLRAAGLLTFTTSAIDITQGAAKSVELLSLLGSRGGRRLIPVPRQVLKLLARCTRPTLAKTVIAYLLRGLSLERSGKIRSAGTVKVSWICRLGQISERAARSARAELIRLGWITKDTGSFQRKLNRDGAYFVINTAWRRVVKRLAPLTVENCLRSAPPKERPETPNGSKNQKPALRAESGVCAANRDQEHGSSDPRNIRGADLPTVLQPRESQAEKTSRGERKVAGELSALGRDRLRRPTLRNIIPEDLRQMPRLEELYRQAVAANWLSNSEANLRNFVSAALRATRAGGRVGAIFAGLVKGKLWHYITQDQEDRALDLLRRHRDRRAGSFSLMQPRDANSGTVGKVGELFQTVLDRSKSSSWPSHSLDCRSPERPFRL